MYMSDSDLLRGVANYLVVHELEKHIQIYAFDADQRASVYDLRYLQLYAR